MTVAFDWSGDTWSAQGEGALLRERDRTLFVADLHLGKAETFRAAGLPVPAEPAERDLERLGAAIDRTEATRLVVLGDLIHARSGRTPALVAQVAAWREERPALEIVLVRGNHDTHAGDPPAAWRIDAVDEPRRDGAIDWRHAPVEDGRRALAGHVHPVVVLRGGDGFRLRAPCFLVGAEVIVLPAFGSFTGGHPVRGGVDDRVIAVRDGSAIDVSALLGAKAGTRA